MEQTTLEGMLKLLESAGGNPAPLANGNPELPAPSSSELARYAALLAGVPFQSGAIPMNEESVEAIAVVTGLTLRAAYNRGREDERNGVSRGD